MSLDLPLARLRHLQHLQFNAHIPSTVAPRCLENSNCYSFVEIGLLVIKQFIYGATFSLNCFPAENAGTLVAGIVIGSLVFGLRPSRSQQSRRSNDPNPMSVTFSPFRLCIAMEKFWWLRKPMLLKARHNKHFNNQYQFSLL